MGVEEILMELLETAREQQRWQRAAVLPLVRKTVADTVLTPEQRRAYDMCDGNTANKKIAEAVGKSEAIISRLASHGRDAGIAYEGEYGTRHLIDLETLDLLIDTVDEPDARKRRG